MGFSHSKEQNTTKPAQTKVVTILENRLHSPQDAFFISIKSLVEQNLYSDLTIICADDRYPVHKTILCPRSTWFRERCREIGDESAHNRPSIIYIDESEDPYVIAAMLAYLYTLDYADEGPQMAFGLPSDGDVEIAESTLPPGYEDDQPPLIEWEESDSESDYRFAADSKLAGETVSNVIEDPNNRDDGWESMTKSSTARKTPSPCHCKNMGPSSTPIIFTARDPGKQINPLALHVQMYKAGVRFGIPCLAAQALKKFEDRISHNMFDGEELIEAASYAWEDHEDPELDIDSYRSLSLVHKSILAQMKARWESMRGCDNFEKLVFRRPGFSRDVLRVV